MKKNFRIRYFGPKISRGGGHVNISTGLRRVKGFLGIHSRNLRFILINKFQIRKIPSQEFNKIKIKHANKASKHKQEFPWARNSHESRWRIVMGK